MKYLNNCAQGTARKSSSNPFKSKSINQSKICSKFQTCISNPFENLLKILAFVPWIAKKAPTYMFDWVLNTYTPEVDNKDTRTTSFMLFMCFYCWLWTNLVHWFSCIFDIFHKLMFSLFWTSTAMGIGGSMQQCCRKGFHIYDLSFQVLQCCW